MSRTRSQWHEHLVDLFQSICGPQRQRRQHRLKRRDSALYSEQRPLIEALEGRRLFCEPTVVGGTIGDFVWEDLNRNGIQNAGEPGVGGVTVNLKSADGSTTVASTTTDGNGAYAFNAVAPGTYRVDFAAPFGFFFTDGDLGGNDTLDSDVNSAGQTGQITLAEGEINTTIDAGLFRPAAVGDFVWNDLNSNGLQDSGEPGLPGVTVHLRDSNDNVLATTTTAAEGIYNFFGVAPGTYSIQFVLPAGFAYSPADQGGNDATDSDANATTGRTAFFSLSSNEIEATIDAGFVSTAPVGNVLDSGDTLTANLFLNLSNTDDIGTFFDVIVRAYKNGSATPFAEGELDRLAAKRVDEVVKSIELTVNADTTFVATDTLTVKVFTRIDAGPGHNSGRLQLQYDAVSRSSHVVVHFNGGDQTFFLHNNVISAGVRGMNTTNNTGDTTVDLITKLATKANGNQEVLMDTWVFTFT